MAVACNLYIEEIVEGTDVGLFGKCACGHPVRDHSRRPIAGTHLSLFLFIFYISSRFFSFLFHSAFFLHSLCLAFNSFLFYHLFVTLFFFSSSFIFTFFFLSFLGSIVCYMFPLVDGYIWIQHSPLVIHVFFFSRF